MYVDNEYKFVVILNKKIETPRLMNALGHIALGLTSIIPDPASLRFLCYRDADDGAHPAISHWPVVVLEARNSNQIRTFRQTALAEGLPVNDFTNTMLGASAEAQLQQTAAVPEEMLEYWAIAAFGPSEILHGLTRRFSLFK